MRALVPVGERLLQKWGRKDLTEVERQYMYRLALAALSEGYLNHVYMDPRQPTWSPAWNPAFNMAGPCPDYIYLTTDIDPKGTYKLSGFRGTVRFVEITQQAFEYLGGPGTKDAAGGTNDLDSLTIGANGAFSVVLSGERPAGYDGDWWKLAPNTLRLTLRMAAYDWINEVDPRIAITRLDDGPPTPLEEQVRRFSNMAAWVEGIIGFDIDLARQYRAQHGVNRLELPQVMLGRMPNQVLYAGAYEIASDEALVIDTALPASCRYWSILVTDELLGTVDWVNRQSSLNGFQARLDDDGRFRAVISAKDPGIHNWLDIAGHAWGVIQLRWNKPSDAPRPEVRKVPFADIRKHLPTATPSISTAERKEALRLRREGAQLRRLW
jgi:hypothetical protein